MPVKSARQNASTPRTRGRIHDAFLKLAESHDVFSITVNDVTNAAGLNRTTFYLHYPDIEALLNAVIDELMVRLNEGGQRLLEWDPASEQEWQETFFRTIAEHPRLFLSLFQSTHQELIVARLLAQHESWFLSRWEQLGYHEPESGPSLAIRATFVAYGVHGLTVSWLESGMKESAETICEWVQELGMSVLSTES